ncbi:hypothetical protein QF011_001172 [Curtobacterium flaccumfaciens]|nr:hypothetical protein [Curtobacterium flaccumfaciens]
MRAPSPRARLPAACGAASAHPAVNAAPGDAPRTVHGTRPDAGREARCQPATRLPAAPAAPCARRRPVRGSPLRAALQARTQPSTLHQATHRAPCTERGRTSDGRPAASPQRASRPHRARAVTPCAVARCVRRCKRAPSRQRCTTRRTAHRAPCTVHGTRPDAGREARCQPATRLPAAPCARRRPVRGSPLRAALQARTQPSTLHQVTHRAPCSGHATAGTAPPARQRRAATASSAPSPA